MLKLSCSWSNCLPKLPSPKTITWGVGLVQILCAWAGARPQGLIYLGWKRDQFPDNSPSSPTIVRGDWVPSSGEGLEEKHLDCLFAVYYIWSWSSNLTCVDLSFRAAKWDGKLHKWDPTGKAPSSALDRPSHLVQPGPAWLQLPWRVYTCKHFVVWRPESFWLVKQPSKSAISPNLAVSWHTA